jgi:integrase
MDTRSRHRDGRFANKGKATTTADDLAAKQAEIAVRDAGVTRKGKPMKSTILHPLFADYVGDIRLRGKDPKTVSRAFYALRRFQVWLEEVGVDPRDVDELRLKQYVAYLRSTVANSSARSETEKIKAAYRYALRIGTITKNPAEYVETPSLDDREPETYSNEELRRIRAAIIDDFEDAVFHLLVYTGMRRFEFSSPNLTWSDVDFVNQTIRVVGKGKKLRKVPLHPRLAEVLLARKQKYDEETVLGAGGSSRNINYRLAKLLERADVQGGNRPAHRFRATVQCSLYEEDVREDVIDAILGWAPKSIRQRYYSRVRDETAHDAILRLYRSDPLELPSRSLAKAAAPSDVEPEVVAAA